MWDCLSPEARALIQTGGNINTPLELAIQNQIDRFTLAMDVFDRVLRLKVAGAHARGKPRNPQTACRNCADEHGVDQPEAANWKWPFGGEPLPRGRD